MLSITSLSPYTSLIGFVVGLPTLAGAYYQAWKTRQESKQAREGLVFSENCLEFVRQDGTSLNVVPLATLHTLPKPGDIVLLPGSAAVPEHSLGHGAYRINRIEHIYARVERRNAHSCQARLAKAVAHVDSLSGAELAAGTAQHMALDGAVMNALDAGSDGGRSVIEELRG